MSSYSDLASQIINKNGRGGKWDGLNTFLDAKVAFNDAVRQHQFAQQLARQQGQTSGAASIISNANIYGTDADKDLRKFYEVTNNPESVMQGGAASIASGVPAQAPVEVPSMSTPITTPNSGASDKNEEYLKKLSPDRAALIKQISEYKSGGNLLSKGRAGLVLQQQVAQYDPNFDAGTFAQRQSFINTNWNKGDLFKGRQAIENMVQHVDLLEKNFAKMNNGQLVIANAAGNAAKVQMGKAEVTNALISAKAVGTEIAKTLRGAGVLNEVEQSEAQKQLDVASSPEQMQGAIQQMMHLAEPRINSSLETYKGVMGRYPKNAYSPEAIAAIKKISPDIYSRLAPKLGLDGVAESASPADTSSTPSTNGFQTAPSGVKYKVLQNG